MKSFCEAYGRRQCHLKERHVCHHAMLINQIEKTGSSRMACSNLHKWMKNVQPNRLITKKCYLAFFNFNLFHSFNRNRYRYRNVFEGCSTHKQLFRLQSTQQSTGLSLTLKHRKTGKKQMKYFGEVETMRNKVKEKKTKREQSCDQLRLETEQSASAFVVRGETRRGWAAAMTLKLHTHFIEHEHRSTCIELIYFSVLKNVDMENFLCEPIVSVSVPRWMHVCWERT